ncbi:hypothetical protein ACU5AY_02540 [Rhizobium sp. PAMB 3174]
MEESLHAGGDTSIMALRRYPRALTIRLHLSMNGNHARVDDEVAASPDHLYPLRAPSLPITGASAPTTKPPNLRAHRRVAAVAGPGKSVSWQADQG